MERDTILMLDTQMHRGGILEQGLNSRGLNVFRTSRSREASNLLRVLKPTYLVISLDGEGQEFYQRFVIAGRASQAKCILLSDRSDAKGRDGDVVLSAQLPPSQLVSRIYQLIRDEKTDQTMASQTDWRNENEDAGEATLIQTPQPPQMASAAPAQANPRNSREWKGNLAQLDVARLFSILMRRRASGKLLLSRESETRRIWFINGTIATAESNQALRQLPLMLLQEGLLSRRQVEQFAEVLASPLPGERLYELRLLERERIESVNRLYVNLTVRSSFGWEEGGFVFLPGAEDLPGQPMLIDLPPVLLQGIRDGYHGDRLLRILGSSSRVPQWLTQQRNDIPIPLNTLDSKIMNSIDGRMSLDALRRYLGVEPALLYTLVYTLMVLGYLTMEDTPGEGRAYGNSFAGTQPPALGTRTGAKKDELYAQQLQAAERRGRRTQGPNKTMLFGQETPLPKPRTRTPQARRRGDVQTPVSLDVFQGASPSMEPPGANRSETPISNQRNQHTPTGAPPFSTMPPKNPGSLRARPPTMSYRAVLPPNRGRTRQPTEGEFQGVARPGEVNQAQLQVAKQQIEQKYMQIMTEDYFRILEVEQHANELEIRRAYQRTKQTFADGRFSPAILEKVREQLREIQQTIQEAYEVLGDPTLRSRYSGNLRG